MKSEGSEPMDEQNVYPSLSKRDWVVGMHNHGTMPLCSQHFPSIVNSRRPSPLFISRSIRYLVQELYLFVPSANRKFFEVCSALASTRRRYINKY